MNEIALGLIDVIKTLVSTSLFTEIPILNIPIIKQLTLLLIEKIVKTLITKTEVGMNLTKITEDTQNQQKQFLEAFDKNEEIKINGTMEDKAKAKEELINSTIRLIRFSK